MSEAFRCLVMLGPAGESRPERWLARAKLAACLDLVERLAGLSEVEAVEALVADASDAQALQPWVDRVRVTSEEGFHFGRALASWTAANQEQPLAYFGGAGAPLLDSERLRSILSQLRGDGPNHAAVNNLHSSDWCAYWPAPRVIACIQTQRNDNAIGWALVHDADVQVRALQPTAASRVDVDTPVDPYMMQAHPGLGRHLCNFLASEGDPALQSRVEAINQVLDTPGSSMAVIGRSGSAVWSALEKQTQVWVRMIAEERGMVASGRMAAGAVRSVMADWMASVGPAGVVNSLAGMVDGVLWDTRVWMGAAGSWPSAKDRFAADLGWIDEIDWQPLRDLTIALMDAEIPILTGGHGLVSGGILALLESGSPAEGVPTSD